MDQVLPAGRELDKLADLILRQGRTARAVARFGNTETEWWGEVVGPRDAVSLCGVLQEEPQLWAGGFSEGERADGGRESRGVLQQVRARHRGARLQRRARGCGAEAGDDCCGGCESVFWG